jgi:hypothetical protein
MRAAGDCAVGQALKERGPVGPGLHLLRVAPPRVRRWKSALAPQLLAHASELHQEKQYRKVELILLAEYLVPLFTQLTLDVFHFFSMPHSSS